MRLTTACATLAGQEITPAEEAVCESITASADATVLMFVPVAPMGRIFRVMFATVPMPQAEPDAGR